MMDVELRPHLLLTLQGSGFHDDLRGRADRHPAHARRGGGGAALLQRRRPRRRRNSGRESLCCGSGGRVRRMRGARGRRRRRVVEPPAKALLRLDLRRQVGKLLRHGVPEEEEYGVIAEIQSSSRACWHKLCLHIFRGLG